MPSAVTLEDSPSARRLGARSLVQDYHLDPSILLSAARRVIVDDGKLGAVAFGADPLRGHPFFDEPVPYAVGPLLRQLDVEGLVPRVVRVSLDQYVPPGVGLEEIRQLVDAPLRAGTHLGLARGEKHATDREHEPAVGLLRLEACEFVREGGCLGLLGGAGLLGQRRLAARLLRLASLGFRRAGLCLGVAGARLGRAPRLLAIRISRLRCRSRGLELAVALLQKRGRHLLAELLHVLLRLAGGAGHRRDLGLLHGYVAEVQPVVDVLRPFRGAQRLLRVDEPERRVGLHVRIGLGLLIGSSGPFYLSLRGPLLLRCAARRDDQREDGRNDLTERNRTVTHLRTSGECAALLRKALDLLAQRLDVLPHLVGRRVGALIGGSRARILSVDRRLLRGPDRLFVFPLVHRRLRGLQLVLGDLELGRRADRGARLLRFVERPLGLRDRRARQGFVARATGRRQRHEPDREEPYLKEALRLLVQRLTSLGVTLWAPRRRRYQVKP